MALRRLENTEDYQVAEGSTDIRGWTIADRSGQEVGTIDGLLFDPDSNMVHYAIADIKKQCVLLPVGQIDIDESRNLVLARGYGADQLMSLRPYREGQFNELEEREHYRAFTPTAQAGAQPDYRHETFRQNVPRYIQLLEEKLRIGKRRVQTGEVVVSKRPVTETVTENIELTREDVAIERHPVNKPVTGAERLTTEGETIRIPTYAEEAVVEKRPVIKEEVEIKKTAETVSEKVSEQVTREELEVNKGQTGRTGKLDQTTATGKIDQGTAFEQRTKKGL